MENKLFLDKGGEIKLMTSKVKAQLFCLHCNIETNHIITYQDKYLKDIKCIICGNEIRINREKLLETYTKDFIDRVLTKPQRVTKEIKRDLSHFLMSIPIRILTKPYRMAKEIGDMLYHKENKNNQTTD